MKQFARCTNCRQWYARVVTTAVEVYSGDHSRRVTMWCLGCIHDAERRSQFPDSHLMTPPETRLAESMFPGRMVVEAGIPEDFQQLVQEHLELMERAIHEDDAIVVPLVEDFMQRCRHHHQQSESEAPELAQRLAGHVQYWETFLKTLRQSL